MKTAGLEEIPPEVREIKKFDDLLLRYCNVIYSQNKIESWTKGCIHPLPKKGDYGITKNYWSITLTSIDLKYSATQWH